MYKLLQKLHQEPEKMDQIQILQQRLWWLWYTIIWKEIKGVLKLLVVTQ
jgi:hypothetical protein